MIPHLRYCQGFAVVHYGFALDAFRSETKIPLSGDSGASSTLAQLGLNLSPTSQKSRRLVRRSLKSED